MEPNLNQFYENYDENGRLLTRAGHVQDMVGISHHTIDIFRKD